jgi:hypothetical protein
VELCLNSSTLHNDTCKGEAWFDIILLTPIHFCEDLPDDGRVAETFCTITLGVFTINTQLWSLFLLTVGSDNTRGWLYPSP